MYQQHPSHPIFGEAQSVRRLSDGASIPFDPANTDYQAFLKWLDDGNVPLSSEEGNTPEAADVTQVTNEVAQ